MNKENLKFAGIVATCVISALCWVYLFWRLKHG